MTEPKPTLEETEILVSADVADRSEVVNAAETKLVVTEGNIDFPESAGVVPAGAQTQISTMENLQNSDDLSIYADSSVPSDPSTHSTSDGSSGVMDFEFSVRNFKSDVSTIMKNCGPSLWLDGLLCCYYLAWTYPTGRWLQWMHSRVDSSLNDALTYARLDQALKGPARFLYERQFLSDKRWIQQTGTSWRPVLNLAILFFPLVVLVWMVVHFGKELLPTRNRPKSELPSTNAPFILRQNPDEQKEPAAFFYSSAFPIAGLTVFLTGIPAAISLWLYNVLGIDPLLGFPSHEPQFFFVFVFGLLYASTVGCCLSVLFFRSWFTFPLNFLSPEYEISLFPDAIWQGPRKGWFFSIMTVDCETKALKWDSITEVKVEVPTVLSIRNLAERQSNPLMRRLVKSTQNVLELQETMASRLRSREALLLIKADVDTVSICLDDLTEAEKSQLFLKIKNYAPSIHLDEKVQEALVGTKVFNDPRYTELWFDILSGGIPEAGSGELEIGQALANQRYRIVERMRSGGEAITYLAEREDGERVVLKRFQLKAGDSITSFVESASAFENESALLSQLDDPRIVSLKDFFLEQNSAFICLEYVEGVTLRDRVANNGVLEEQQVIEIAKQLCEVLHHLHDRTPPIVHRDISPDNIMLLPDGSIKLIDFSVAEQRQEKQISNCVGKHAYTPPEQFRCEASAASDIYALGGVLYYLLVGRDPVPICQITTDDSALVCTPKMSKILATATALELDHRYTAATWMLNDLFEITEEYLVTDA